MEGSSSKVLLFLISILTATIACLVLFARSTDAFLTELEVNPIYLFSKRRLASLTNWAASTMNTTSAARIIISPASFLTFLTFREVVNTAYWSLIGIVAFLLINRIKNLLFSPINRVKLLGEVGYKKEFGTTGIGSREAIVAIIRKRRHVGDVPPVYPNGWYAVLESRDLKPGDAKSVSCLGKMLAVFRGEDGTAHVLDAYCPHMGANLAVGGVVKKNCLECPFHGWQFRGDDGKCVHVPYCEDKYIPESAGVTSYCSLERNGFVFFWFHAEGCDPQWEPPVIEGVENGSWKYGGRSEHIVNTHIEEIPENASDMAHLQQVHGPLVTTGVKLNKMRSTLWDFARHDWVGSWTQHPEHQHIGQLDLVHMLRFFGKHTPILDVKAQAFQIGPGMTHLPFQNALTGEAIYIMVVTPIEPMVQRIVHHVYVNARCPIFLAKIFLHMEALMFERDLMVWNNKTYIAKPLFLKSKQDSLVSRHRRWYSQFYTENSPRLDAAKMDDDW